VAAAEAAVWATVVPVTVEEPEPWSGPVDMARRRDIVYRHRW
jgi:hypothetical protein